MKTIFFCLLCLATYSHAIAQTLTNPGTPEERSNKITLKMKETLELDSLQLPLVDSLNLHYARVIQKEVLDQNLGMLITYRKAMKINSKKELVFKSILTEGQWKKYLTLKSESRQLMMNKVK